VVKTAILYSGKLYDIQAITINERCPVKEFLDNLGLSDQKKIFALLQRSADSGLPKNEEKFKKLHGEDIFEFKSFQVRILCFVGKERSIILTNGFIKKRVRTPGSEIERAKDLRKEYEKGRQK